MFVRAAAAPASTPRVGDDVVLVWTGETYRRKVRELPQVVDATERVLARVVEVVESGIVCTPLARPKIEKTGFGPCTRLCVPLSCVHEVRDS